MADVSNCIFEGGWTDLTDVSNNFNVTPSDEVYFLIFKNDRADLGSKGILIFKQYGFYAYANKDYSSEYDNQSNYSPNYMPKNDILNYFESSTGSQFLEDLSQEQRDNLFNTIEND